MNINYIQEVREIITPRGYYITQLNKGKFKKVIVTKNGYNYIFNGNTWQDIYCTISKQLLKYGALTYES